LKVETVQNNGQHRAMSPLNLSFENAEFELRQRKKNINGVGAGWGGPGSGGGGGVSEGSINIIIDSALSCTCTIFWAC
jgi:hypothetical protein